MSINNERIANIVIDNKGIISYQKNIEREINVAIYDLVEPFEEALRDKGNEIDDIEWEIEDAKWEAQKAS